MSDIVISVDGVDITADVVMRDAEFSSAARGSAGTCAFRIKDTAHEYLLTTGKPLTLDIDGIRCWGGYIATIERGYWFEADCTCKTATVPRYLRILGTDYNVLLQRRILYDKDDGTNLELTKFPAGSSDQEVLTYYLENHTDILDDGVTTSLIEEVASPYTDDPIGGHASWRIDDFCRYITQNTGAIYYIDPDKAFVLTDVDTPNALKGISDDPDATEVGCRELEIDFDGSKLRNDALAWGLGGGPDATRVFSRVQDSASIAEHGLWQWGSSNQTIFNQSTIDRVADSAVYGSPAGKRGGKDDRVSVKCTVYDPVFRVAQKVAFRSETFGFADVIPVRSSRITFPTGTQAQFDLILSHEIDDPWTTFEFWYPPMPPIRLPPPIHIELPPHDPCTDGQCVDTFTRVETGGLGISEFSGATWTPQSWLSVNGSAAKLAFFFVGDPSRLDVTNRIPFDIKFRLRIEPRTGTSPSSASMWFMLSSQTTSGSLPTPFNAAYHGIEVGRRPTYTFAGFRRFASSPFSGFDYSTVGGIQHTDIDPLDYMWVRWRIDDDGEHLKLWQDGTSEPTLWQTETTLYATQDTHMWVGSAQSYNVGNPVPDWVFVDSMEVTEGILCNGAGAVVTYPSYPTIPEGVVLNVDDSLSWVKADFEPPFSIQSYEAENVIAGASTSIIMHGGAEQRFPEYYAPDTEYSFYTGGWVSLVDYQPDYAEELLIEFAFTTMGNGGLIWLMNGINRTGTGSALELHGTPVFGRGAQIFPPSHEDTNPLSHDGLFVPLPSSGVAQQISWQVGELYMARLSGGSQVRAKVWRSADEEPLDWIAGGQGIGKGGIGYGLFPITNALYHDNTFTPSTIRIISTEIQHATDPCDPNPAPLDPCTNEWVTENLTRISTPIGRPAEKSYYQTTYQWALGTMVVWVDGLLIRGDTFSGDHSLKYIEIDSSIDVGGGDVFDTSKSVTAYYYAACTP